MCRGMSHSSTILRMGRHQIDVYLLGIFRTLFLLALLAGVGDVLEHPRCRKDTHAAAGGAREGWWCEGIQERVRCVGQDMEE